MKKIYSLLKKAPHWSYALALTTLVLTVAVAGSSPTAVHDVAVDIPQFDKVMHFGAFGLATALLWLAQRNPSRLLTWALIASLGALDEYHQSFLSFRTCDIFDWLTDALAALVAVSVLHALRARSPNPSAA